MFDGFGFPILLARSCEIKEHLSTSPLFNHMMANEHNVEVFGICADTEFLLPKRSRVLIVSTSKSTFLHGFVSNSFFCTHVHCSMWRHLELVSTLIVVHMGIYLIPSSLKLLFFLANSLNLLFLPCEFLEIVNLELGLA